MRYPSEVRARSREATAREQADRARQGRRDLREWLTEPPAEVIDEYAAALDEQDAAWRRAVGRGA